MFRYEFALSNFESTDYYNLLSEVQYTKEEFSEICKEIIKTATLEYIENIEFDAYIEYDHTMFNIYKGSDYSDSSVECWSNDDYQNCDVHLNRIFKLFLMKGFVREELPIETTFHFNIYCDISAYFSYEIVNKISQVCEEKKQINHQIPR
jgi:hypothetical protein